MNMCCFSRRPEFVTSTHIWWLAITCDTLFSPGSLHTCVIHSQRYTHIHINKKKNLKMSQHCFKPKSLEVIIVTLCPWYQKTSYILSTHNGINTSILTGRNKSTLGKEQTKARPKANRENTKPFSSISGIWYSWWNHLDSRGLSSPASFATWVLRQWTDVMALEFPGVSTATWVHLHSFMQWPPRPHYREANSSTHCLSSAALQSWQKPI